MRRSGDPGRAIAAKAYLHSDLTFFGVGTEVTRRHTREMDLRHGAWSREELRDAVRSAWSTSTHELRAAAIELLVRHRDLLSARDVPFLERLLRTSHTWAYVDELAVHVVGPLLERTSGRDEILARWARDPDFWIRRSSLLALLGSLRRTPDRFDQFARLAAPMLREKEFFIRKVIGWILREVGKRWPALTYRFLSDHRGTVSGLTLREGAKYLPAPLRSRLGLTR
ncbi:MAG TPA: DNA alkylation repair protein [Thermoplasmata archaeon]